MLGSLALATKKNLENNFGYKDFSLVIFQFSFGMVELTKYGRTNINI
jgi:hypothetical protein